MVRPIDRPRQRNVGERARLRQCDTQLPAEIGLDPGELARGQIGPDRDMADQLDRGGRELPIQADYASARITLPGDQLLNLGQDAGGALRVGPESAGANPGPVAYGQGGTQVTVTDANVVLGYLNPEYLVGGALKINAAKARAALETSSCV